MQIFFHASGAEPLKFVQGFVIRAFDARFVAGESVEGVGTANVVEKDVAEADGVGGFCVSSFEVLSGIVEPLVGDALLDGADAAKTPRGADQLLDESVLRGRARFVFGLKGFKKIGKGAFVLRIYQEIIGGETVFEALLRTAARPSGVRGPMLLAAFRRLASICFWDDMRVGTAV